MARYPLRSPFRSPFRSPVRSPRTQKSPTRQARKYQEFNVQTMDKTELVDYLYSTNLMTKTAAKKLSTNELRDFVKKLTDMINLFSQ